MSSVTVIPSAAFSGTTMTHLLPIWLPISAKALAVFPAEAMTTESSEKSWRRAYVGSASSSLKDPETAYAPRSG